jgi:hypothetical protein
VNHSPTICIVGVTCSENQEKVMRHEENAFNAKLECNALRIN